MVYYNAKGDVCITVLTESNCVQTGHKLFGYIIQSNDGVDEIYNSEGEYLGELVDIDGKGPELRRVLVKKDKAISWQDEPNKCEERKDKITKIVKVFAPGITLEKTTEPVDLPEGYDDFTVDCIKKGTDFFNLDK